MTIKEALFFGESRVGLHETNLIISHLSKLSFTALKLYNDEILQQVDLFYEYVKRRQRGEPLQYILGEWDFMGFTFKVDKRALIPRQETELLVEEVLGYVKSLEKENINVLDMCTGTGCIALSVACLAEAKNISVTAVDISDDALSLAEENLFKFRLEENQVKFIKSDLFENITGLFDVIVSNPPYILTKDMAGLNETVKNYEPHLALDGGNDGLDIYKKLIPESKKFLYPSGRLFLEIGSDEVESLTINTGFKNVKMKQDYAGLNRIIIGEC